MAAPYLFPAFLVPILIIHTESQTANISDVIVINSGHAEAIDSPEPRTTTTTELIEELKVIIPETIITTEAESTEGVVFVPNGKEVEKKEHKIDISDILYKKTVADILNDRHVRIETEAPDEDIVFISGKNNENEEVPKERNRQVKNPQKDTPQKKIVFNCSKLDCNNTLKSICGMKKDNSFLKYRLFLNECYFRKVNCNFKYDENRYKMVDIERCDNIGSHNTERPFSFKPIPLPPIKPEIVQNYRRSPSSRRSLTMGIDGTFCSHACPASCPDHYDPECAVSGSGQRRVFVNHCKMDLNSCFYNVVWHRRPLSECVGGKKADMQQNRGFISWMQKVGIVDKKGRLVLS